MPAAAPESEAVAAAGQKTEAQRLAVDLQRLRNLIEHNRMEVVRRDVKELEQRWPGAKRVQHYARVLAPPAPTSDLLVALTRYRKDHRGLWRTA